MKKIKLEVSSEGEAWIVKSEGFQDGPYAEQSEAYVAAVRAARNLLAAGQQVRVYVQHRPPCE